MSSVSDKSRLGQGVSQSATPFVARHFDVSAVQGLSARALEVHLGLYEGYVKETNELLPLIYAQSESQSESQQSSLYTRLQSDGLIRRFAFERNGMLLHELFFAALRGPSDPPPARSEFSAAIARSYGNFGAWQDDIRRLAQRRGIGWVLTLHSVRENRLSNVWIDEHSHGVLIDCAVVCAIDLWEHAYLIDYKPTDRLKYVQTLFDNIDWEVVADRCEQ